MVKVTSFKKAIWQFVGVIIFAIIAVPLGIFLWIQFIKWAVQA